MLSMIRNKYLCLFNLYFSILLGLLAIFILDNNKHLLNELKRSGIVVQLEIAVGNKPESLDIMAVIVLGLARNLNIMGLLEYLQ